MLKKISIIILFLAFFVGPPVDAAGIASCSSYESCYEVLKSCVDAGDSLTSDQDSFCGNAADAVREHLAILEEDPNLDPLDTILMNSDFALLEQYGYDWAGWKAAHGGSRSAPSPTPKGSPGSGSDVMSGTTPPSPSGASALDDEVTELEEVVVTPKEECPAGTGMDASLKMCVPTGTGLSEMSVQQVLLKFLDWLLAIIGTLMLLAFLISGAQYLLAFGDDGMIETAKNNMKWSIVGVAVAFGSYVIVQTVGMLFS